MDKFKSKPSPVSTVIVTLAFSTLFLVGCSGGDMVKATGELRVDGKLVDNATISFYPVGGGRPGNAYVEDGVFEVSYKKPGDGLPPGEYKVAVIADTVRKGREKKTDDEAMVGESEEFANVERVVKLVPQSYNNIQTTPLRITITDSMEPIKLDIDSKAKE